MTQQHDTKPHDDREPELEAEPIKDLDVDETQTDEVRGGMSIGGTRTGPTH